MDPNPNNFPILSFVMSKLPSFTSRNGTEFDLEQPPPPPSVAAEPSFELTDRMPRLTDPKLIASMRLAVSEVAQTRSVLQTLGDRPDHEAIDIAKARLVEIDSKLSDQLDEIALSDAEQPGKEEESKRAAKEERRMYKAVIELDEMHDSYEKLLREAEEKLEKIYEAAAAGGVDAAAEGSGKDSGVAAEEVVVNEEVIGILREALGKGMERIELGDRKLRFLPEEFGRIPGLVVLNLASNFLQVVPDSISGLGNLEELNLSSNLLESLPESIGLLANLKILNVSGNKLNSLPDSICHCRSLLELDASFNKLTYLPTNIGYELVNLRRLSISLNKIRSLPTSIGEMSSLQLLDVHFNELRGLPQSIGRLTNLEFLNLSSNFSDLTELPDTITDLANLKELDLSNNQIHALPDTFSRLDNLTKLNLDQNPIVIPPVEIVKKGVEAVKVFMANRWLDILAEEEEKSMQEANDQTQTGWLNRSTSWLNNVVTGVSESVSGYLGSPRSSADPYLNQQL